MSFITAVALSTVILTGVGIDRDTTYYESMAACKKAVMEQIQLYDQRGTIRHVGNGVVFTAVDGIHGGKLEIRMNCTETRG